MLNVGLLARYDGNSAIQSDHRWMFTPAASAEWNLKNHFFTGSTALSGLSLRASYARIAKSFQSDRYELGPQYLVSHGVANRYFPQLMDLQQSLVRMHRVGLVMI